MINNIFHRKNLSSDNSLNFNVNLLYNFYKSYNDFLNFNLKVILKKIFPIYFYNSNYILNFEDIYITYPVKNYYYCINKGLTYSVLLNIKLNLSKYSLDKFSNIKKEYVTSYIIPFISIPLLTNNCSFIINGIEKFVVSKFERSPGIFFLTKKRGRGKIFIIRVVPDYGYEVDFFIDNNNHLFLKINNKEFPITNILKCMGLNRKNILNHFYEFLDIIFYNNILKLKFDSDFFLNYSMPYDILDFNNNVLIPKNKIINSDDILKIKNINLDFIKIDFNYLLGKNLGCDLIFNNKKISKIGDVINKDVINKIKKYNINSFKIIIFGTEAHKSVCNTLIEYDEDFFYSLKLLKMYFSSINYVIFNNKIINFSNIKNKHIFETNRICRKKMNFFFKKKLYYNLLNHMDLVYIVKLLIAFKDGFFLESDKNNLSNLSLLLVGDILEDIIYNFFFKLKKKISFINFNKYKCSIIRILNFFNLNLEIKKFFSTSKFSQYLDQVNLMSELSHKRKVNFLGIIGISKKYSGFDSRDLNSSHYSRICPVETPEGINIGLVGSLALLTRLSKDRSLISPYHKVLNGKVLKKWNYISFEDEFRYIISYSKNLLLNKKSYYDNNVICKYRNQLLISKSKLIDYVNILPYQILSISCCLIPFLEHNDSNRALMASNMLKQALPCLIPERPYISTGLERLVCLNSNDLIISNLKSYIKYFDSNFLLLKSFLNYKNYYYYNYNFLFLIKYISSNQNTIKSQRISKYLKKSLILPGDVIADSNSSDFGELALGQNLLAAFMPWNGYNFEDSVIVSENILKEERYTSLNIIQIDVYLFKTLNGYEILSKNIFKDNFNFRNLNSFGIVNLGTNVYSGDILIGKMTPIADQVKEINSENKLLHSIFSKDNFNYTDTSFYLPNNFSSGIVSNIELYFSDCFKLSSNDNSLFNFYLKKILNYKKNIFFYLSKKINKMLIDFLIGKEVFYLKKKIILSYNFLKKKKIEFLLKLNIVNSDLNLFFSKLKKKINFFLNLYELYLNINKNNRFKKKLPLNTTKLIRITIIMKRKLQVGDKMCGRYGNKGVISKILPSNEMPYLINGTPIEIILNPLGVPSRMNIGQLLEIHLGFCSLCLSLKLKDYILSGVNFNNIKNLLCKIYSNKKEKEIINNLNYKEILNVVDFLKKGFYFSVSPFSDFNENNINKMLNIALYDNYLSDFEISEDKKKVSLFDGITGKKFQEKTSIGLMYFFKLNHLAEEKIHARSVGPYTLVTQQPLKGKSNLGGQRLGEMEVWALEAYGASYSLQEMLTIKSDDILGRFEAYQNIIKGFHKFNFNRPETFNVMMKNINALSLYIRFNEK